MGQLIRILQKQRPKWEIMGETIVMEYKIKSVVVTIIKNNLGEQSSRLQIGMCWQISILKVTLRRDMTDVCKQWSLVVVQINMFMKTSNLLYVS